MTASDVPEEFSPPDDSSTPNGSKGSEVTGAASPQDPQSARRRELVTLELHRLRQEASALRLEARAAKLQTLLHRIDAGDPLAEEEWQQWNLESNHQKWHATTPDQLASPASSATAAPIFPLDPNAHTTPSTESYPSRPAPLGRPPETSEHQDDATKASFDSWGDLRHARQRIADPTADRSVGTAAVATTATADASIIRRDAGHAQPPQPRLLAPNPRDSEPGPESDRPSGSTGTEFSPPDETDRLRDPSLRSDQARPSIGPTKPRVADPSWRASSDHPTDRPGDAVSRADDSEPSRDSGAPPKDQVPSNQDAQPKSPATPKPGDSTSRSGDKVSQAGDQFLKADDKPSAATDPNDPFLAELAEAEAADSATDDSDRRRRPAAFVVSALVHVALVLILGMLSLTTQLPKDQVALSASASTNEENAIETFEIQAAEPTPQTPQSEPVEAQVEISPLGTIPVVDVTSDFSEAIAPPAPELASLSSLSGSDSLRSLSSSSDSKASMEFCGVEGGGNHFVYLVDSSGSMGDAFQSARAALLQSVDLLTPKQRFYVVFFDAECDYMRIADPAKDEPRSVFATPENKRRLKSWAMKISMDRGRAPYEPLEFALSLRPDVIFLLSDGEFPQGIERLLSEKNRVSNLFGDEDPISIVHTIGYHSREGEERMRRIAAANQGQYRHVPRPR